MSVETEFVEIERSKLQALLDVAVHSMDFGSGFWDRSEAEAARWAAEVLGVCPNACTPSNILEHFPPCEGTIRQVQKPFIGRDGKSHQWPARYQHLEHGNPLDPYLVAAGWEPWHLIEVPS